jgi:hypothetical protein
MWMVIIQGTGLFIELLRLLLSGTPTYAGALFSALSVFLIIYLLMPQVRTAYLR